MLVRRRGRLRLVEVKSAASVKEHYNNDVAIQYWVLRGAGHEPAIVQLMHIDTSFVYPGNGDYRGLFTIENLTREAKKLQDQVPKWIRGFRRMLGGDMPGNSDFEHSRGVVLPMQVYPMFENALRAAATSTSPSGPARSMTTQTS